MKYLILACLAGGFLQSCLFTKEGSTQRGFPTVEAFLPYAALDRSKLDTSFDYEVLVKKPVYVKMPEEVMAAKLTGNIELNVLIDEKKSIADIDVIKCELFKKKKLYYFFSNKKENTIDDRLKRYLLNFMQDVPFKQTKEITKGRHRTYYFITFIK